MTRQPWRRAWGGVGILLLGVGAMGSLCQPERYRAVSLAPSTGTVSWERTVNDWTRRHQVFDWMDRRLDARATYHAPAFRKSFLDHRKGFFGDFADKAYKELVELGGGEAEEWHSFFLSAFVDWQKYKAMSHSHTIWTLTLENDQGVAVVASKIKDVRINPGVAAIYPYVDRFDKAYLVRFPLTDKEGRPVITAQTRSFTLRVESAYAKAQLLWDLVPLAEGNPYGLPRDGGRRDSGEDEKGLFGLGNILGE